MKIQKIEDSKALQPGQVLATQSGWRWFGSGAFNDSETSGGQYQFYRHRRDPVPGGSIVAQDYYFLTMDSYPAVEPLEEFKKVFLGVYSKEGRETRMGIKLPGYFIEAGLGAPDGTDVSGLLLPIRVGAEILAAVYRSVLPLALKHGVTTEERSVTFFDEIRRAGERQHYLLFPLLISAWRLAG